jgi:hypothetical protein
MSPGNNRPYLAIIRLLFECILTEGAREADFTNIRLVTIEVDDRHAKKVDY